MKQASNTNLTKEDRESLDKKEGAQILINYVVEMEEKMEREGERREKREREKKRKSNREIGGTESERERKRGG